MLTLDNIGNVENAKENEASIASREPKHYQSFYIFSSYVYCISLFCSFSFSLNNSLSLTHR